MNKKVRLIVSTVLFIGVLAGTRLCGLLSGIPPFWETLIYIVIYLIAGADTVIESIEHILHGELFDEDFLMLVASACAFAIGSCSEAVAVIILFGVGELFEEYAGERSERSVSELLDLAPHTVYVIDGNSTSETDAEKVAPGTEILISPGGRIPIDSVVISGESTVDTSPVTGESVPVRVLPGTEVFSGCINGNGSLVCKTLKEYSDSVAAHILDLVKEAGEKKSVPERFITSFSKIYTPAVTGAAILAAAAGSLITGDAAEWISRACAILVISCPCALVISVPMAFFAGIGATSRKGILVKGSAYIGTAASLDSICFDKTGTLTDGNLAVSAVVPFTGTEDELIRACAMAEGSSSHPYAKAVVREAQRRGLYDPGTRPDLVREIPGEGIAAEKDGVELLVGNRKLMGKVQVVPDQAEEEKSRIYVASDGKLLGFLSLSDNIKPLAGRTVNELKELGIRTYMFTGDTEGSAKYVADNTGIDEFSYGLLPGDKVACVEKVMEKGGLTAFVGDGINDAPVLMRADLGIAMGCLGSDSAVSAADIVLMDDDITKLPLLVSISKGILRIVRTNIIFALSVKLITLLLSVLGVAPMWLAVFADVGVTVIATANSMRALKLGNRG